MPHSRFGQLYLSFACTAAYFLGACSVPEYRLPDDQNAGGQLDPGGRGASGGASSNGGSSASGASGASGGTRGSGGSSEGAAGANSGSTSAVAGGDTSFAAGGASSSTGGAAASGGMNVTGGSVASGGALAAEETNVSVTGGSASAGGVTATEGSKPAGGTAASGGTPSTGGRVATGGVKSTGGVTVAGGGTAAACAAGYGFCDNFESYTVGNAATAWVPGTGTWSVGFDATAPAADQQVYSNKSTSNSTSQAGTAIYANASIEARIRVTSFSSTSSSSAAGLFLRNNGNNDYDLALGADGALYLRRAQNSSTAHSCSAGSATAPSGITIASAGCAAGYCTPSWFKLKLVVHGTTAAGITITAYIDRTGSSGYTQAFQCTQDPVTAYTFASGTAGVFSKGSAQAEYDDVLITVQ